MIAQTPALLQLIDLPVLPESEQRLQRHFQVLKAWEYTDMATLLDSHSKDIQVIVTSAMTPTGKELFDHLPVLQAICSVGVGYDGIDTAAAHKRQIQVSNTPDVLNDCVADLAWGLIIATSRGMGRAERHVRSGQWVKGMAGQALGRRVTGKKLGIVGLGRIGQAIAQRATAFSMQLRYHNRRQRNDVPWPYESSLRDLALWADILVVATVGGSQTRHLINESVLQALGSEGILINIARGSVVDEQALVAALKNHTIAAAGLDVFENEPHIPPALLTLDNVVLLPHIASATLETRQAMVSLMLDNVEAFASTGKLLTPIPV